MKGNIGTEDSIPLVTNGGWLTVLIDFLHHPEISPIMSPHNDYLDKLQYSLVTHATLSSVEENILVS
jgi:hypothetical protein